MAQNLKLEEETFHQIIALNAAAFEGRHFDTAYHLLAAALHWARDFSQVEWLSQVEDIANEQLAWIDQNAPAYHHSTRSAEKGGNPGIFRQLARQCHTGKSIIKLAAQVEQRKDASLVAEGNLSVQGERGDGE